VDGKVTATVLGTPTNNHNYSTRNSSVSSNHSTAPAPSADIIGPLRVFPGRLSVSRTFGDVEAKMQRFGGNPNVVVCVPEIKAFKIDEQEHDFVLMGCDGIFDRLSNRDSIQAVWNSVKDNKEQGC